jgi:DNA-binding IclR family transcriptional regulator
LFGFFLIILNNADGKTLEEISEATGVEPSYAWFIAKLLTDLNVLRHEDGRYYINEESRAFCELMIKNVLTCLD